MSDEPKRGVGRPSLGAKKRKKLSISMDPEVLGRVRAAAGEGGLSAWLERATLAQLERESL